MGISIDNYLRTLSGNYYLKNNSDEVNKINNSVNNLFNNLNKELGDKIKRKFIFGSYDRDTILPRKFDSKSDVDIMVVFNHTNYERTPDTYRNWLKDFADKYYKDRYGSEVIKSFPTVAIKLSNIHYDLVPAKEEEFLFSTTIYIPGISGWRSTEPNDVKQKLTEANTRYSYIVRPIIRLLKAWNCSNSYPYDSYLLELQLTGMNFSNDNIQSGFFYAVDRLDSSSGDPQSKKDKIERLKYNIGEVKKALDANDIEKGKRWLHKVLPEA